MKKYIFFLLLLVSQRILSQDIQNSKLKYDNDFKPYIETTIKNTEQKNITNVEFEITYKREYSSMWDVTAFEYKKKVMKIYIPAQSNKFISFYILDIEDYRPLMVSLKRIRFSDGTVKIINN